MRARLVSIDSDDIIALDTFSPNPTRPFSFVLIAKIGPRLDDRVDDAALGADIFYVTVMNPLFVDEKCEARAYLLGEGIVILREFNLREFEQYIEGFISRLQADTWPELADKLKALGHWEFTGMKHSA